MNEGKVVKVRFVKRYKDAKNHVCIGEVKAETNNYLVVKGRTFHFGSSLPHKREMQDGLAKTRWIPWHQIELVTELPADINWKTEEFVLDASGDIVLRRELKRYETALPRRT
jgi:hypothetical protein